MLTLYRRHLKSCSYSFAKIQTMQLPDLGPRHARWRDRSEVAGPYVMGGASNLITEWNAAAG